MRLLRSKMRRGNFSVHFSDERKQRQILLRCIPVPISFE